MGCGRGIVFKRTVLYQFGIETSLARVAEFLEEDAIEVVVNKRATQTEIKGHVYLSHCHQRKQQPQKGCQKRFSIHRLSY